MDIIKKTHYILNFLEKNIYQNYFISIKFIQTMFFCPYILQFKIIINLSKIVFFWIPISNHAC